MKETRFQVQLMCDAVSTEPSVGDDQFEFVWGVAHHMNAYAYDETEGNDDLDDDDVMRWSHLMQYTQSQSHNH